MATTVLARSDSVFGDQRTVLARLTTTTSSDTYNTGLSSLTGWSADGGSAAVTTLTVSGGTVTIGSSSGVTNFSLIAWGY